MVRPSLPANVGAAARAIKTMGFSKLVLVSPKVADIRHNPDAIALASGAVDILEQCEIVSSLSEALASSHYAFALTSRQRELAPQPLDARQTSLLASHAIKQHQEVAIVLGTERTGLENHEIDLCTHICHIPANPSYASLNVSQALQVLAWEVHYALTHPEETPAWLQANESNTQALATHQQVQNFLTHWEQALIQIDFLNPNHPKKLMPRMRHLFSKTQLSQDEVAMLRGVCTQILKKTSAT